MIIYTKVALLPRSMLPDLLKLTIYALISRKARGRKKEKNTKTKKLRELVDKLTIESYNNIKKTSLLGQIKVQISDNQNLTICILESTFHISTFPSFFLFPFPFRKKKKL